MDPETITDVSLTRVTHFILIMDQKELCVTDIVPEWGQCSVGALTEG